MSKKHCESLEPRRLMAWSAAAHLIGQDAATVDYPSITGKGTTVAVIDTGIDYSLAALGGGFGAGKKVIGGYDFYANDSDPMDEDGHGTAVASIIAAEPYRYNGVSYQGIAPDANLVALRVGTESSISDNNIERALQWVISNYKAYKISVVNLSLGSGNYASSTSFSPMSASFTKLRELGIFVTAASGNSNDAYTGPISQDGIAWPAADPNVFSVGAINASDVIADWSQRGSELDLLAPGVDMVMPKLGGGYVTEDGTSFASPAVAGAAALIKQADPTASAGDIGSILMTSGTNNRDGDQEIGNTTTLAYSRLNVDGALKLTASRTGFYSGLNFGANFDTALDPQGILHVAWYDATRGRLLYVTRDAAGLWSKGQVVDDGGDVGAQVSIAVDTTGKVGIGYFDVTNTAIKYAAFNGSTWSSRTIESEKYVGTSPSLAFDINGNAYLAYYRKSGGDLRMATLKRDAGTWTRRTIDGTDGSNVGACASLDVGQAAVRGTSGFTEYHTTVAIAYSDSTNGDLKYARLDLDDPTATWYTAIVENANGVGHISLDLHANNNTAALAANIAYQDAYTADVKYAYRNTNWFVETVASTGKLGDSVALYFDASDRPMVSYYDRVRRAFYTGTRTGAAAWSIQRTATGSGPMAVGFNERTGNAELSWLNRPRTLSLSLDPLA